jgi:peptidoglycan hydrolase CwlO-like protein
MKVNNLLVALILIFLGGCATTTDFNRLKRSVYTLENKLNRVEKKLNQVEKKLNQVDSGLLANQNNLKNELKKLHSESKTEFQILNNTVRRIKNKTDKFNVRKSSNTLLFEPTK